MTNPYPAPAGGGAPYGGPAVAPPEVQTAFKLYIVNIVVGLIGIVVTFLVAPSLVDAAIAQQAGASGVPSEQLRAAAQIGAIVGAVFGLVVLALYLLFIFKMRAGRNWARIVLAVLSAISIIITLAGIGTLGALFASGGLGVLSGILSLVQLVLLVAAVFFMFRPAANAYFKGASQRV